MDQGWRLFEPAGRVRARPRRLLRSSAQAEGTWGVTRHRCARRSGSREWAVWHQNPIVWPAKPSHTIQSGGNPSDDKGEAANAASIFTKTAMDSRPYFCMTFMKISKLLATLLLTALGSVAQATTYNYSYTFTRWDNDTPVVVHGSFDGTASGSNLVTNLSNITASIDGLDFNRENPLGAPSVLPGR